MDKKNKWVFKSPINPSQSCFKAELKQWTYPVCPLTDSPDVGFMPFPWHTINHLTVIYEVASDVSTADEGWLFPGQHHRVTHTLQDSDAIGRSRRRWDDRNSNKHDDVSGGEHWGSGKLKVCMRWTFYFLFFYLHLCCFHVFALFLHFIIKVLWVCECF